MIAARALPLLTEYDGDLSGLHIDPLGDRPVSPTRLEAWVAARTAWFMQYVLGLQPVEQPDEQLQITPRDRGTLVHAALDLFHRRVIAGELPQPGPDGWERAAPEALLEAFETEARPARAAGSHGPHRVLAQRADSAASRAAPPGCSTTASSSPQRRAQVVASEHRFGMRRHAARRHPTGRRHRGPHARLGRPHRPLRRRHAGGHRPQDR